ncbi:MAG: VCBS repeat-containing protein [Planctomycetota bacterium]
MNPLHLDGYSKTLFAISAIAISAFVLYFTELAKPRQGDRLERRWAAEPVDATAATASEPCHFVDVTEAWGVHFVHAAGAPVRDIRDVMGSGVAVEDLNGDGNLDLLFVNASTAADAHHELYLNRGHGSFDLAPGACGLSDPQFGMGCVAGDLNGDGKIDVVVTGLDETRLYLNCGNDAQGRPTFRNVAAAAGLEQQGFATAAALNDLDQDGDLDLVIVRYLGRMVSVPPSSRIHATSRLLQPRLFHAESDPSCREHRRGSRRRPGACACSPTRRWCRRRTARASVCCSPTSIWTAGRTSTLRTMCRRTSCS